MAGLRATVAAIVGRRRAADALGARPPPGLTQTKAFGPNPGGLRMFSYAPADLKPGAALVVVLHGCGQGAGFAEAAGWLQLADRHGFAVLAPQQRAANNPSRCFNWFQAVDIRRGRGEAASIRHMTDWALEMYAGDAGRVFVTGLSAGGAMAAAVLATYPEAFSGGAILAGLPYRGAQGLSEGLQAMRRGVRPRPAADWAALVREASAHTGPWPRVSVWQGGADSVVNPVNAEAVALQWAALHGLTPRPSRVERPPGRRRSVWRDRSGAAVVELHEIDGLGHGAPIGGVGPDAIGRADAFVLETGIESSLEIARFWGLVRPGASTTPADGLAAALDGVARAFGGERRGGGAGR